jgi:hypothetical protein
MVVSGIVTGEVQDPCHADRSLQSTADEICPTQLAPGWKIANRFRANHSLNFVGQDRRVAGRSVVISAGQFRLLDGACSQAALDDDRLKLVSGRAYPQSQGRSGSRVRATICPGLAS